jgi:hypothetical protein
LSVVLSGPAIIKHYARKAGIAKAISPHTLRHAFATHLHALDALAGVLGQDLDLLGHRSTRVTTDYRTAELRNLLDAANRVQKSRNDGVASDSVRERTRNCLIELVGADGIEPPTFAL